jgi:hypothetical protein
MIILKFLFEIVNNKKCKGVTLWEKKKNKIPGRQDHL